jgi:ferric-dicitrate binding protein FerR (iron transport regulator)
MKEELLQRYVEGIVSKEEIEEVVDWLNENEEHVDEFMALSKLYHISLFNNQVVQETVEEETHKISFRKITYEILKIAAIFLIIWGGLQFWHKEEKAPLQYQTLFVPAGQRAELILADSSKVWLNSLSKITYSTNFNEENRIVKLDGEAFFDVSHDSNRPFIVKTGSLDIQVFGTEFNVTAYSDNAFSEVSLLKGSVEVKPAGNYEPYKMKENEKISFRGDKIIAHKMSPKSETGKMNPQIDAKQPQLEKLTPEDKKLYVSRIKDYDYFKWREGLICFNNETVEVILEKLQKFYDVQIVVDKPTLLKQRYSGKFRTIDGVEQVIKVLQLEHKFSYVKNKEQNLITIK